MCHTYTFWSLYTHRVHSPKIHVLVPYKHMCVMLFSLFCYVGWLRKNVCYSNLSTKHTHTHTHTHTHMYWCIYFLLVVEWNLGMCWAVRDMWMVVEMCQVGYLAKSCSLMVSSLVWVPLGAAHHFPSGLWWYLFLRPNYCLLWPCVHAVSNSFGCLW